MTHIQPLPLSQDEKNWLWKDELSNPDIAYTIENMPFTHVLVIQKFVLPWFLDSSSNTLNILQTNIIWYVTALTSGDLAYVFVIGKRSGLANNLIALCEEVIEIHSSATPINAEYLKSRLRFDIYECSPEMARQTFIDNLMHRTALAK